MVICSDCGEKSLRKGDEKMISRLGLLAGVALLVGTGWANAQQNQPLGMPGTVVGTSLPAAGVSPVGSRLPNAAPVAGSPVGRGPGGIPAQLDPRMPTPPGQPINMQKVVGPYPMMDNKGEPGFWDSLYNRWAMLFVSDEPAKRPTNFTPGISRRNRERNNMFRRD
jgi:hypothetical protein